MRAIAWICLITILLGGTTESSAQPADPAELVTPEVDALVHVPGDVSDLCRGLLRLASGSGLRQRLGTKAHERAVERFNPDRLASEIVAVYEQIGV